MKKKKIVLAYSGGLDTSVILHWLKAEYNADVIAYIADLGQGEDLKLAAKRAKQVGSCKVYVEDLKNLAQLQFDPVLVFFNSLIIGVNTVCWCLNILHSRKDFFVEIAEIRRINLTIEIVLEEFLLFGL